MNRHQPVLAELGRPDDESVISKVVDRQRESLGDSQSRCREQREQRNVCCRAQRPRRFKSRRGSQKLGQIGAGIDVPDTAFMRLMTKYITWRTLMA
jgi:hypothetical protein